MLNTLSQNKKIAISAMALFLVSFAAMLLFLESGETSTQKASVLNAGKGENNESVSENAEQLKIDAYKSYLKEVDSQFFVTTAEGKFIYMNDEFCELLSVKCEDLKDKPFFDYINSKDLSTVVSNHTKLIQDGEPSEGLGPYRMIKGKEEILVLFSAYPILGEDLKVSEIVFSVKDLTAQAEELNENGKTDEKQEEDKNWIKSLYPKIKEMKDENDIRRMVDKISFIKE